MGSARGVRLGRFDLLFKLGGGGSGSVFLAWDNELSNFVACKVYPPSFAEDEAGYRMMHDEARIGFRLHHPAIPRLLSFSRIDGLYVLSMEYVFSLTLKRMSNMLKERKKRPAFGVTASIFAQLYQALHAVHQLRDAKGELVNIVHRDIAPQNILVGFDGRVSLIDFGVMKSTDRGYSSTTGHIKGRPQYFSPEQDRGDRPDHRSDIYSVGVVLWEFLTQRSFRAKSKASLVRTGPRPADIVPGMAKELDAICCKAMQRVPGDRFPTAESMQRALDEFSRGQAHTSVQGLMHAISNSRWGAGAEAMFRQISKGRGSLQQASRVLRYELVQENDLVRGQGNEPDLLGLNATVFLRQTRMGSSHKP